MKKSTNQTIENPIQENPIQERPIQQRLKHASCITVESAIRNKVNLNISWYDVHGDEQSQQYSLAAGTVIEL
ncbi:hypothetical protein [Nitrosopumilus adriaticus]|uniref:Uncharacterized protein n=1 Tax=Nitrosopumilus adriaticus TaxID=1580092 RepID=A0A0D5C089_9ARCH|nr:hypothetical protein [Nitrosopumilus adriaticus]AJW70224.1 hypothetical protein NADRNF5_0528 [Nitrosopumilus adriaticus]